MQEPPVVIDASTENGSRADARLRNDQVAWLVTVAADGTPVPTPVWFWWDGDTVLVYSQRDKPKLRHIAANPRVSLALRTDPLGDEITVITGEAAVDESAPQADALPAYVKKYGELIARLGADPPSFAREYTVPIRIRPTRLRQWRSESAE
jgi:PPOX class probable F420-dependent enzyme